MILVNVVVAVLLDEFSGADPDDEAPLISAEALFEPGGAAVTPRGTAFVPKIEPKPKTTEAKLDLLLKQMGTLMEKVERLERAQPQAGSITDLFSSDVRAHGNNPMAA